jgi:hypothetical protein
MPYIME